ncbi:MAG: hypothetical protein M1834_002222 [Cirrosporium novae-zelandiae]|nr:MAG: hypothetical protein M1834_002222 [Cirrosporium novae-zelandiae]
MLDPLYHLLEEVYGVSKNGFLPAHQPLKCLPDRYYQPWEAIVGRLPALLLVDDRLRGEVDDLEILITSRLHREEEWQRAYLLLGLLTHAYIWGGEKPAEKLPPSITVPFLEVSAYLGLPPTATYAALSLWNFQSLSSDDIDLTKPENLGILHTFTGSPDEAWFYIISVAIEARGAPAIPLMLKAIDAAREDKTAVVVESLNMVTTCIRDLEVLLERMHENCDPHVFYYHIRPYLAGTKNMAAAGLPAGVFYDEGFGKGRYRQYSGGSNAQSSLIQLFDIFLGVEHRFTGTKALGKESKNKEHAFIKARNKLRFRKYAEMRDYMPGKHRNFLQYVTSVANIRSYIESRPSNRDLKEAYNATVEMLGTFRNQHIQIVTRYIILPSRKSLEEQSRRQNIASASSRKKLLSKESEEPPSQDLHGTGGTMLIPFLKQTRNETKDAKVILRRD